jgi:hypothetical protein
MIASCAARSTVLDNLTHAHDAIADVLAKPRAASDHSPCRHARGRGWLRTAIPIAMRGQRGGGRDQPHYVSVLSRGGSPGRRPADRRRDLVYAHRPSFVLVVAGDHLLAAFAGQAEGQQRQPVPSDAEPRRPVPRPQPTPRRRRNPLHCAQDGSIRPSQGIPTSDICSSRRRAGWTWFGHTIITHNDACLSDGRTESHRPAPTDNSQTHPGM